MRQEDSSNSNLCTRTHVAKAIYRGVGSNFEVERPLGEREGMNASQ